VARALRDPSPRRSKPFLADNRGAPPDRIPESELLGSKAGAFTNAKKDEPGPFARAEA
jgi:DNA-binding NtrC family response regulator